MIRQATLGDVERLHAIETVAGEQFRQLGMDRIADDEEPTRETLGEFVGGGTAWVFQVGETVCAYLVALIVDDAAHVEQVSVDPAWAGRGIGAALIEYLAAWARASGLSALTLTTYRDVPWNAPYYARLGFRTVAEPTPALSAIRAHETALGLDEWPRVVMRRSL